MTKSKKITEAYFGPPTSAPTSLSYLKIIVSAGAPILLSLSLRTSITIHASPFLSLLLLTLPIVGNKNVFFFSSAYDWNRRVLIKEYFRNTVLGKNINSFTDKSALHLTFPQTHWLTDPNYRKAVFSINLSKI